MDGTDCQLFFYPRQPFFQPLHILPQSACCLHIAVAIICIPEWLLTLSRILRFNCQCGNPLWADLILDSVLFWKALHITRRTFKESEWSVIFLTLRQTTCLDNGHKYTFTKAYEPKYNYKKIYNLRDERQLSDLKRRKDWAFLVDS